MRIGLFGGTFNPIHFGHLGAALEVKEYFALDKIHLMPSALPPHKEPGGVADAKDRLEMACRAVSDYPDFLVSDIELKRPGTSYTIDTVYHFKSFLPKDTGIYLIMGIDAFLEIDSWRSYPDLFMLIPFIIMARPGPEDNAGAPTWKTLENYIYSRISDGYKFSYAKSCYVHAAKQPVFIINVTPRDISSTKIRQFIKNGMSIHSLVPEKVEGFIKAKGLYL